MRRLLLACLACLASTGLSASTKLLRFPDIHGDQVVFCYAGDLWRASMRGGPAVRITAHPGVEVFPRFSPDGKFIAFTGQYDGDEQVYIVPVEGGEPRQLTWYPAQGPLSPRWGYDHIVYGWTPDGKSVLFRSLRYGYAEHPGQLYTVDRNGGPAVPLAMPRAGAADYSPDGKRMVYSPLWRDFRTWKRYEGGWAQDLYLYELETGQAKLIAPSKRTERDPMWIGDAIYFVSDRTGTLNLFRHDNKSGAVTQLTKSDSWDVRWASSDNQKSVVYELGGELHVFDVTSSRDTALAINVSGDGLWDRPSRISVAGNIEDFDLSPKGERALFTARGDIFTAPIENGPTRNLTRSSGAHDRAAVWSADGKQIAFLSDQSGEEELYLVPQDGSEKPRALTSGHRMRLYRPLWSPDSKRIAFADKEGRIFVVTVDGGKTVEVANERDFQVTDYVWSPCGQWLAFSLNQPTQNRALYIWGVEEGKARQVTDGFFGEHDPAWDPDGKLLWYLSEREYQPVISSVEWSFASNRMTGIYALALRKDVIDPFAPKSDEVKLEGDKDEDDKANEKKDEDKDKDKGKDEAKAKPPTKIDFEGLGQRVTRVPVEADNYLGLTATPGHLIYGRVGAPYYARESEAKPQIRIYELEKRKETTLVENAGNYTLSTDGKKLLAQIEGAYQLYDATPGAKDPKRVSTSGLQVDRVPREEWRNIFEEVVRRYRDFFYAENMHGYDWLALRKQYEPLLAYVGHRSDLNYLIGEMIAELNVGHAYIEGGDWQRPERAPVALLGAKLSWDAKAGHYRIAKILRGQNEEPRYRSPLTEIGVDVKEGDFILAIDGDALRPDEDPYRLLVNRAANPVTLTVASGSDDKATRSVKVNPIRDEGDLIYLDWVERNRAYVDKRTGGKVGYMHIPDMGGNGAREFIKWYYPQSRKNGLIIDDRSNGGGNISQWLIDRLSKKLLGIEYARTSETARTYPDRVMRGPMAMLISETSASDGDIFPYMFREAGLGPLIGKRTWGGVIGISGQGVLIDGGRTFVPQYGNMAKNGRHAIEGEGVTPDIEVENAPADEIAGKDAQLDRAIDEVMKRLAQNPAELPPRPADPVKTKRALAPG